MQWYEDAIIHNSQYFYDHNGDRYRKVVDGVLTNYFYHHEDIVKEQVGAEAYEYLHGPGIDEPAIQLCLGINCPVASSYYYADGLGSIRQLADSSGNILNQYPYGAWREINAPFIKIENIHNDFAYTSREIDNNYLYYYRNRFYNSDIYNFISKDIFKYVVANNYNYVDNSPIIFFDPFGLKCIYKTEVIPVMTTQGSKSLCKPMEEKYYNTWQLLFCRTEGFITSAGFIPLFICICDWQLTGCRKKMKLWCDFEMRIIEICDCPYSYTVIKYQKSYIERDETVDCIFDPNTRRSWPSLCVFPEPPPYI
jgi:RHS repeat-associated protein